MFYRLNEFRCIRMGIIIGISIGKIRSYKEKKKEKRGNHVKNDLFLIKSRNSAGILRKKKHKIYTKTYCAERKDANRKRTSRFIIINP